jgi:ClpP class serine protease
MYNRIKAKYFSAPLLMEQSAVDNCLSILSSDKAQLSFVDSQSNHPDSLDFPDGVAYYPDTRVGVIDICGPFTYKKTRIDVMCGDNGVSDYQSIEVYFEMIAQQGALLIITMSDTPGGEAYGVFETGRNLRAIADAYGVKWIAYNDGIVASAG